MIACYKVNMQVTKKNTLRALGLAALAGIVAFCTTNRDKREKRSMDINGHSAIFVKNANVGFLPDGRANFLNFMEAFYSDPNPAMNKLRRFGFEVGNLTIREPGKEGIDSAFGVTSPQGLLIVGLQDTPAVAVPQIIGLFDSCNQVVKTTYILETNKKNPFQPAPFSPRIQSPARP